MSTDNEGNCSELQTAIQVKAYQLFFHKPDALFSNKADFQTNTYLCHFLPLLIKKISKPTWQLFFFFYLNGKVFIRFIPLILSFKTGKSPAPTMRRHPNIATSWSEGRHICTSQITITPNNSDLFRKKQQLKVGSISTTFN